MYLKMETLAPVNKYFEKNRTWLKVTELFKKCNVMIDQETLHGMVNLMKKQDDV